ncbi:MAG TPA: hypothetical protein VMZ01_07525 [Aestuariivirga sp.]|nr:hypothetical protein [Aestuariivirga sp.]
MKNLLSFVGLALVALAVTGCGSMSISRIMGDDSPSVASAQTHQDLSMPPDLQLRAPGTVTSEVAETAAAAPATRTATSSPTLNVANPSQGQAQGDVYERNGISKVRADGTPKSDAELKAELKKVYLAKKQQTQPHYGTIFNMGNIFKDG